MAVAQSMQVGLQQFDFLLDLQHVSLRLLVGVAKRVDLVSFATVLGLALVHFVALFLQGEFDAQAGVFIVGLLVPQAFIRVF